MDCTGINYQNGLGGYMKTIPIGGANWKIKTTNEFGGCFDNSTSEITIGVGVKNMVPVIFLHEVLEAIMTERG